MTRSAGRTLAIAALLLAAGAGLAWGQSPPKRKSTLDDELLKELGADPLDDVDHELFGPGRAQPGSLSRELGAAGANEDENPLLAVANRMRDVEGLLARNDSGPNTQQTQRQVVAALEKLIAQARKQCKKCSSADAQTQATAARKPIKQPGRQPPGASQGKPESKPAADSNAKAGHAEPGKPDVKRIRSLLEKSEVWGSLPQRQRQQLLQLPMEEFLPKYEQLIIEYFKRLSQGTADRGTHRGE